MYSNKKNVLQLVSLLKAHEIKHVVLSPGSRNSPIVQSLSVVSFFTCHSVVDERSAGFYATGILQRMDNPVAICCTSGSAVLNYGPAVSEAYYQNLPLLVITADRPASSLGQNENQTIPQPGIFGSLVRKSFQLPEINTTDDEWYCNRLINEAILELSHHGCKPVHINVPISEPLFDYTVKRLPNERVINRISLIKSKDLVPFGLLGVGLAVCKKPMLLIGQYTDFDADIDFLKVLKSFKKKGGVILAEHLSGVDSEFIISNFDSILYALPEEQKQEYAPDFLITIGGHIVSKRIKQFLRTYPPMYHLDIQPSGDIIDTYHCLTNVIEDEVSTSSIRKMMNVMEMLEMEKNAEFSEWLPFFENWRKASLKIPQPSLKYSDMMVIGELMKNIPDKSSLHLANSNSVRLAQLFNLNKSISVYSNRGTSGIDGCLSTAVGHATVIKELVFIVIGDLAFFYDMNALWNCQLNKKLRVLLNNNGGGEIFYTLPGLKKSEAVDKYIAASHSTSAKAWAETMGLTYLSVTNEEDLKQNMPLFVSKKGNKPILMEVFTSAEKNVEILENYYQSIKL
jgi:2-succinyl-5-enolpyruvyl-6-hydroxy-3-cyclohexene-1-carboxylate synthase